MKLRRCQWLVVTPPFCRHRGGNMIYSYRWSEGYFFYWKYLVHLALLECLVELFFICINAFSVYLICRLCPVKLHLIIFYLFSISDISDQSPSQPCSLHCCSCHCCCWLHASLLWFLDWDWGTTIIVHVIATSVVLKIQFYVLLTLSPPVTLSSPTDAVLIFHVTTNFLQLPSEPENCIAVLLLYCVI